jgi:hypothetical protein
MRTFPERGKESLKFENIFSLRYSCASAMQSVLHQQRKEQLLT